MIFTYNIIIFKYIIYRERESERGRLPPWAGIDVQIDVSEIHRLQHMGEF